MRFIQLTLLNNSNILINVDRIDAIYPIRGMTEICVNSKPYCVVETYDEIVNAINNYDHLPKA